MILPNGDVPQFKYQAGLTQGKWASPEEVFYQLRCDYYKEKPGMRPWSWNEPPTTEINYDLFRKRQFIGPDEFQNGDVDEVFAAIQDELEDEEDNAELARLIESEKYEFQWGGCVCFSSHSCSNGDPHCQCFGKKEECCFCGDEPRDVCDNSDDGWHCNCFPDEQCCYCW
jgi:hypothetical protein